MDAVDGLGTQMELLKTKMTLYKEQHGTDKCSTYRDPVVTARWVRQSGKHASVTAAETEIDSEASGSTAERDRKWH